MWFMFVVPFIVFFIIFLSVAINMFHSHKNSGYTIQNMVNTISAYAEQQKENEEVEKPQIKEENKICEYCGSVVKNKSDKCGSCGAKIKK